MHVAGLGQLPCSEPFMHGSLEYGTHGVQGCDSQETHTHTPTSTQNAHLQLLHLLCKQPTLCCVLLAVCGELLLRCIQSASLKVKLSLQQ